jgi:hypothetical protein
MISFKLKTGTEKIMAAKLEMYKDLTVTIRFLIFDIESLRK